MIDTIVNNVLEVIFGIFLIVLVSKMLWEFVIDKD